VRGRKPNPHRFGLIDGAVGEKPAENAGKIEKVRRHGRGRPAGRPVCPSWFSREQRDEFNVCCALLEEHGLLAHSDQAVIVALALARDQLREATEAIQEAGGRYSTERVPGAWTLCPACKGAAAKTGGPRCRACRNRGALQKSGRLVRVRRPEVRDVEKAGRVDREVVGRTRPRPDQPNARLVGQRAGTPKGSALAELARRRASR
jgi:phage terminase small subunit